MPGLSIVIPAYNEQANVVSAVEKISAVAQTLNLDYEIILVNDGSRDQTGDLARTELVPRIPHFRLVEHFPNRGLRRCVEGWLRSCHAGVDCLYAC